MRRREPGVDRASIGKKSVLTRLMPETTLRLTLDNLLDRLGVGGQIEELEETLPLSNDSIDEIRIAIELILNHVVEYLEQEEHEVVIVCVCEQEGRRREGV